MKFKLERNEHEQMYGWVCTERNEEKYLQPVAQRITGTEALSAG